MIWFKRFRFAALFANGIIKVMLFLLLLHLAIVVWLSSCNRELTQLEDRFLKKHFANAVTWGSYEVVWDTSVVDYQNQSTETKRRYDVSLLTQCSVNNMHHLLETLTRWDGPVSVSIFTPGSHALQAVMAAKLIKLCSSSERLAVHFVYPTTNPPTFDRTVAQLWYRNHARLSGGEQNCRTARKALKAFNATNYALGDIPYPHNTLRNVAKRGVRTSHVMLLDIDVMPSHGVRDLFLSMMKDQAKRQESRSVYVLPAFELQQNSPMPRNKAKLVRALDLGMVRPFHTETCPQCHQASRYDDWLALALIDNQSVAFELSWASSWEPFYLSSADVPLHDERFQQYGYDRISQVCELHIAGYRFHLLANAFVVHKGFKKKKNFHRGKEDENRRNWMLYEQSFTKDLKEKYPNSQRACLTSSKRQGKSHVKFKSHFEANVRLKQSKEQNEEL